MLENEHLQKIQKPRAEQSRAWLLSLLRCCFFLRPLCRFDRCLGRKVHHYSTPVATACRACAVRHARGPALANSELLGHKGVVRTAVCRVAARMSPPHYHGSIYSICSYCLQKVERWMSESPWRFIASKCDG